MFMEIDVKDRVAIIKALTSDIDRLCVAIAGVNSQFDELKYNRLTIERSYLVALRMRIFNCEGNDNAA